jgi:DNA phosphorothioation-associated putative methyltransferase
MADRLLLPGASFFDYGCGRGDDVRRLISLGYEASGWDPVHRPDTQRRAADVVNLGYVINVIEDAAERGEVLRSAWGLAKKLLVVAARPEWESRGQPGRPFQDGVLTERGTFQKFYAQDELRVWIDRTLGVRCIAAAPGIFYVFRDDAGAQSFLAARVRHHPTLKRSPSLIEALYQAHRELLEPLVAFVEQRGRLTEVFET